MPGKHRCGIYVIEQVGAGRFYIGSSANIENRWYGHRRQLAAGTHHSAFLQNAWNKHGAEAFRFYVIEECDRVDLIDREQEYLEALQPQFNICPTAGSRLGAKNTEQGLANVRRAHAEYVAKIVACPAGHPYDEANTGRNPQGKRYCRKCAAERSYAAYAAETPEQREYRLLRAADYYERTKDLQADQRNAYTLAHKEEKRAYDASRAELKSERDRERWAQRKATETPEQRAMRLAQNTADYERHKAERLAQQKAAYRATHPEPQPATACKNGHAYTDGSFRIWRGKKLCSVCRSITKRAYRQRAAALPA